MLWNCLKAFFRNQRKHLTFFIITVGGLAVSMAIFILISLFVWFEFSFDRFHSKADRIYKVVISYTQGGREYHYACTGNQMIRAFIEELPEIRHITRLGSYQNIDLHYKDNLTVEKNRIDYLRVDTSIFDVFDIQLISGDPGSALDDPNSIILTEELATELYGEDDPMDRIITITKANFQEQAFYNPNKAYRVTGIAKALPVNSHFDFDFLLPYCEDWDESYIDARVGTYLVLPEGYSPERLEQKLPAIVSKYFGPEFENVHGTSYEEWVKAGGSYQLHLQSLKDIYLDSFYTGSCMYIRKGNKKYVYMVLLISFFILLLACTNFILMSVARSTGRIKEVAIRKINGAEKVHLITHFLIESILLSMLALIISLVLVDLLLPSFNNLVHRELSLAFFSKIKVVPGLIVLALFVGVLASTYPAFILSSTQPVTALSGGRIEYKTKGFSLKNSLVIFQFIISIVLIVSSLVVYNQLNFMQKNDPGFDTENIIVIRTGNSFLQSSNVQHENGFDYFREQRFLLPQTFKQELLKHPNISSATVGRPVPGRGGFNWWLECRPEETPAEEAYQLRWIGADPDYIATFGLQLIAGRNYTTIMSPLAPGSAEGIVLNETAVKYFGWHDPIGKYLIYQGSGVLVSDDGKLTYTYMDVKSPVIGVVKDFYFKSMHSKIEPLGIWPGGFNYISVKIQPNDVKGTIDYIKQVWNKFAPEVPFHYSFLGEDLKKVYNKEIELGKIVLYFTMLAIFIACLGLFGLSAFTIRKRTKEIGIRKVLGASSQGIFILILKLYIRLLVLASLIAWPIGYIIMNKWLNNFAYQINFGISIFLFTALLSLIMVLMAVSSQVLRASLIDPAETLRIE